MTICKGMHTKFTLPSLPVAFHLSHPQNHHCKQGLLVWNKKKNQGGTTRHGYSKKNVK